MRKETEKVPRLKERERDTDNKVTDFLNLRVRPIAEGVERIEVNCDKICLWGAGYSYEEIIEKLGKFSRDKSFNSLERMPFYGLKFKKMYPLFQLNYFTDPRIKRWGEECYFEIIPKEGVTVKQYKGFLSFLQHRLPKLKLCKKTEIFIDFYPAKGKSTGDLYWLFKQYLTISGQREVWCKEDPNSNSSLYIGRNFIIYEKGNGIRGGSRENLDRVRLEMRVGDRLKKHGINTLLDLIKFPALSRFWKDRNGKPLYQFKMFSGPDLPLCNQPYSEGSFHKQRLSYSGNMKKNLAQNIKKVEQLEDLEKRITKALIKAELSWRGAQVIVEEAKYQRALKRKGLVYVPSYHSKKKRRAREKLAGMSQEELRKSFKEKVLEIYLKEIRAAQASKGEGKAFSALG